MAVQAAAFARSAGTVEEPINVNPDEVTIRAALDVGYHIHEDNSSSDG